MQFKISNYDYPFFLKELAKEFEVEFNCFRKNSDKCKNVSVAITKGIKKTELIQIEKKIR